MFYERIINSNYAILWLINLEKNNISKNPSESKRVFEKRAVSILLKEQFEEAEIKHTNNGAPFIEGRNDLQVSISHSLPWICLCISTSNPVGVDIQIMKKDLSNQKKHFVNQSENTFLEISFRNLYLIWGAKEAFYKYKKGQIKNLKEDVTITAIVNEEIKLCYDNEMYQLNFEILNTVCLVYMT